MGWNPGSERECEEGGSSEWEVEVLEGVGGHIKEIGSCHKNIGIFRFGALFTVDGR